jgi:hypothetical protein
MVTERERFNNLSRNNVGDYVEHEKTALDVFKQLQKLEGTVSTRFGIGRDNLLSNKFKGIDFTANVNTAINAYVNRMTSTLKNQLQSAEDTLADRLAAISTKAVGRVNVADAHFQGVAARRRTEGSRDPRDSGSSDSSGGFGGTGNGSGDSIVTDAT